MGISIKLSIAELLRLCGELPLATHQPLTEGVFLNTLLISPTVEIAKRLK